MGKKISELTEINSAPSDAYTVIEHGGQNYKVKPSGLSGGGSGGDLYIYTAAMGNMASNSYQSYINNASSPKQAYDTSKTLYILPSMSTLEAYGSESMIEIPAPPSNMSLSIDKLLQSGQPNSIGFGAFVHNGFVYLGFMPHLGGLNKIITSPVALIQV